MKVHELKILPEYFDAVRCGDKRFEIRKNDRDFHSGDILCLKEWDGEKYTGEEIKALVRYVLYGIDEFGLAEGYCIMSIDLGERANIVMCKDCKYNDGSECIIKAGWFPVAPDWFCADGERR